MAYIGVKQKTVVVPEPVRAPSWVPSQQPERVQSPELVPVRRQSDGS